VSEIPGLVDLARERRVVAVHFSDFDQQKDPRDVELEVKRLGVTYPVAHDPANELYRAYGNRTRPDLFFFDARGRVRHKIVGASERAEWTRILDQLAGEV
jgi:thioredoxin-related protein